MKTLLIPIDFSDTSANVIRYATDFVKDVHVDRIILLKSYCISMAAQLLPSIDYVQVNAEEIADERLKVESHVKFIAHKLLKKCNFSTIVESGISELPLLRAIHEIINTEDPDLIMIGNDHGSREGHSPIGEEVIGIAKISKVPLMIIPANLRYRKIETALVPCDFAAVSRMDLLKELRSFETWLYPGLIILNVDPGKVNSIHAEENIEALKEMLESYAYRVCYSEDQNILHGILDFSEHNDVELIIALPGHYSFFNNLTHKSITNALEINSNLPVMILK
jgi:nucleotide-binding universal stress UspA family protein